jgi:ATP-dependent RNA helicase RhlE
MFMSFSELGLHPEILKVVEKAGYTEATPIQKQAIPIILSGKDVMGGAQTGTGKTAGFTLPLLHRLMPHANSSTSPARHRLRALILAPTRELAIQVFESVRTYGEGLHLRAACIYGGVDMRAQIQELRQGIEIVVATPGRLLDHVEQKTIDLSQVDMLVLDEADRMLDMGFIPDVKRILSLLPAHRQSLLFSATFSNEIKKLADQMLKSPVLIEVARRNQVSDTIAHRVHPVSRGMKPNLLVHLLRHEPPEAQALIFVDTRFACNRLAHFLERHHIQADAIHGDKGQTARNETLDKFKQGKTRVLVATDVAARGLDIDHLPMVINFDLPHTAEDYVHRIGRTGRAGRSGNAISLVCADEKGRLAEIEKLIKREIEQVLVPGFDPEPDFFIAGKSARKPAPQRVESPKSEMPKPEMPKPTNEKRKNPPERGGAFAAGVRSGRGRFLGASGFDFSKPYVPSASSTPKDPLSGEDAPRTAVNPFLRPEQPLAFLLGGLGRKKI